MGLTTGVLLDSTFLVEAERSGMLPSEVLVEVEKLIPADRIGISVVSLMEMAHGEARADSRARAAMREAFLTTLLSVLDIYPVTAEIARRAGRLDGLLCKQGNKIAFADLLIGVTALDLNFTVVTKNIRHFEQIPGVAIRIHKSL